jgi:uracil-DNA glycosylase family 4
MNFIQMDDFFNNVQSCTKCSRLCKITPIKIIHNYINTNGSIFVIGRNPGIHSEKYPALNNEEFVKYHNNFYFKSAFAKYVLKHIKIEEAYFTNFVKCESPNNSELTDEEYLNCSEYLKYQLDKFKPKKILFFSKALIKPFKKIFSIDLDIECLKEYEVELKLNSTVINTKVIFLMHPSYLRRNIGSNIDIKQNNFLEQCMKF